ncbi:MAG: hypothetical protein WCV82_01740 [Candidatus Paceibacterota bacterium]
MKRSVLLFVASFIILATTVSAQGLPSTIGGLDLSPSASNPVPNQDVTITAKSFNIDIHAATLTWVSAGKTLAKGVGVTTLTVKAPTLGKKLVIDVTAVASDGAVLNNSITISSGSIDLIIEPAGYVPPFFRGKIPVAYQNSVKIVAVPHIANTSGVEYDPKTLVYKWQQNDKVLENQSGYGRQSVNIQGNIIPRPYDLTVTVTTRDGSAQSVGLTSVAAGSPSLAFYRNDPLYGPLFNNAVGRNIYIGTQREVGILAVPYGFNMPSSDLGDLSLTWLINGIVRPELASNRSVTLRAPDQTSGSSNVQLNIENKEDILQQARGAFSAIFNSSAGTSDTGTNF